MSSVKTIINWQSFGIAPGETTHFNFLTAAGASPAVLNRVTGPDASTIAGILKSSILGDANNIGGSVFLLNPHGILFSSTAQINVGSLVASTLSLADNDFLTQPNLTLTGTATTGIQNQGTISALGDVYLIAHTVRNDGTITAGNHAGLAAGTSVTLLESGNERLTVEAGTGGTGSAVGVENTTAGKINAVVAELKAAGGNIYALAINNGGEVRATSLVSQNGRISLRAADTASGTSKGKIANSGLLQVSGSPNDGVTVEGSSFALKGTAAGNAGINAGTGTVNIQAPVNLSGNADVTGGSVLFAGPIDAATPVLTYQAKPTGLEVSWDTAYQGFVLKKSASPAGPWTDVTLTGPNTALVPYTEGPFLRLEGPVGQAGADWKLVVNGSSTLPSAVGSLLRIGTLELNGPATLNGGLVQTLGAQNYTDMTLGAPTTLKGTTVGVKGNVVGAGNDLSIEGIAVLGDAQADTISGVKNLSVSGTTLLNAGSVATTEKQTYTGDLTAAGGNKALTATTAETKGNVIGGGNDMAIVGSAVLGDAQADTVSGVKNLSVSGTTLLNAGTVTTTEKQTYTGDLTAAGGNKTLTGTTIETKGNLAGGGNDVAIAGDAVLGDAQADAVSGVKNLTVSGTTLLNAGAVTTTEKQTYTSDVTAAGGNKTLTATTTEIKGNVVGGGNDVAIVGAALLGDAQADTVTGVKNLSVSGTTLLNAGAVTTTEKQTYTGDLTAAGGNKVLTATTVETKGNLVGGGNDIVITGGAVLGDAQADTVSSVKNLTVSGATLLNAGTVTTTEKQVYGDITAAGGSKMLTATTVETRGNVVGGGNDVSVTGAAVLGDAQADTVTGVKNLTVSGTTLLNVGSVTTTEKQMYTGDLTVGAGNKTLTASTVETKGNVIGGGNDVAIVGAAVLGDTQADTVAGVKNLSVSGTTLLNAGVVTTSENQQYGGAVTLSAPVVLGSTGGGAIALANGASGPWSLDVNTAGATSFGGPVAVAQLTTDAAGTSSSVGVQTTGVTEFKDDTTIAGLYSAATFTADKGMTLANNATITAASVLLAGPVSGGFGLVVNGALAARDFIGIGTKLNSLTVHGPFAFDGGSLSTAGDQTYDGPVTLGGAGAQVLDAGAGKLSANNTITKTTPGNLVLGGGAGVDVAGALNVSGGNLRVAGDLTAGNNVSASQDIELQNATVAGAVAATAGRITTANLSASSVSAGGPVLIGGSATVSGNVQGSTVAINGPAILGADVTATAGVVGFGDVVTLNGSGDQTITAGVGGITTGTGKAMAKTTLGNLFLVGLVNLNGDLAVNQGNLKVLLGDVTSMGNISASGDISLQNASALGRDITAGGSVNALSLTAGNVSAGSSLGVLNDATVSGNMTAGSTLAVNGTARLGGNATAGNGATFGGPLFLTGSQAQTVDAGAGQLAANDKVNKAEGDLTLGGNGGALVKGLLSADSGNLNVTDDLTAQADVSAGKALTVQGASQFAGNANAGNGATLNGAVTLNGPADQTISSSLGQLVANNTVTKNTPGNLTLSSGPGVLVKANLVVNAGSLTVQNDLTAGADVTAKGATFQGAVALNGNTDQTVDAGPGLLLAQQAVGKTGTGNLLLQGANGVTVQGNLSVAPGALTISGGPTTLQGNMASANGATFNSALTLNGADQSLNAGTGLLKADSTVTKSTAGNLTLAGGQGVQLANSLAVNDGNLAVQNALIALGSVSASKDLSLAGAAQVAGNVAAGSALLVGGPATLGGDVTANGALFQSSVALNRSGDQAVNAGTGLLQANSTISKNTAGNLLLQGQQGVNVGGNISIAPGALTVSGGNATLGGNVAAVGATFNGPVSLNGADQVVDAGTGKLVGNGTLTKTTPGNLVLGGDQGVQVASDIAVNGGDLVVQDSLAAQGGVQASRSVTLQDAAVAGNLAAGNALSVNGSATVGGNASAGSGATFSGPLALNGATDQSVQAGSGQLLANGPVTKTGGNLALGGSSGVSLKNTVDVTGGSLTLMNDLTSLSTISASQDVNLRNTDAGGSVTAGHDINVNGDAVLGGNLVGGHNTALSGGATLSGSGAQLLEASAGRLSVGGAVTKATGDLDLAGSTGVALGDNVEASAGTINIIGPANLNGNLVAGQGATINGPLTLSGGDQSLNANAGKLTLTGSVIDSSGNLTLAGHNGVDVGGNLKVSGGDLHFGDKIFFRAPEGFSAQAPAARANGAMTFGGDIELFANTRVEATGFAFTGPIIDNGFAFILNGINPLSFADDEMKRRLSSIAPKETRAEGKPPQYLSETRPPFPYPGWNKGSSEVEY